MTHTTVSACVGVEEQTLIASIKRITERAIEYPVPIRPDQRRCCLLQMHSRGDCQQTQKCGGHNTIKNGLYLMRDRKQDCSESSVFKLSLSRYSSWLSQHLAFLGSSKEMLVFAFPPACLISFPLRFSSFGWHLPISMNVYLWLFSRAPRLIHFERKVIYQKF